MTGTPPLRDARLRLEPLRVDHADEMVDLLSDPELYRFTGGEPPGLDTLQARYTRQVAGSMDPQEQWHNWVVRVGEDGPAAGYVQATVRPADREAELAWLVARPWQGRGDAAALVRDEVLRSGVRRLLAHVHSDHVASQRVAAALGLRPTARVVEGEVVWRREEPVDGEPDR